jgi:site-specific DNA recombinase
VLAWRVPFGYRRVLRSTEGPARLEIYEPEAAVVRRIFDDYVTGGHSTREVTRRLNADGVPSPRGNPVWGTSTIGRLLRNEAYIGRVFWNKTEAVPDTRPGRKNRQVPRPREDWIQISVPSIIADDVFESAQQVSRDNSQWSPRNLSTQAWILRGMVRCGACGTTVSCSKMHGRNGTFHRYYYCRNHDPLRAGGEELRCSERHIRADELDAFVFDQIREALLRPDILAAGDVAMTARRAAPDDEILDAQLARLDRRSDAAGDERRRVADLYQAGLLQLAEVQRRAKELDARSHQIEAQRQALTDQRAELSADNRLVQRIGLFAEDVLSAMDGLDFVARQKLLRLVVEEVKVTGWDVEIHLRIPLDSPPPATKPQRQPRTRASRRPATKEAVSSNNGLRSLGGHFRRVVPPQGGPQTRRWSEAHVELEITPRGADFWWPKARTENRPRTNDLIISSLWHPHNCSLQRRKANSFPTYEWPICKTEPTNTWSRRCRISSMHHVEIHHESRVRWSGNDQEMTYQIQEMKKNERRREQKGRMRGGENR